MKLKNFLVNMHVRHAYVIAIEIKHFLPITDIMQILLIYCLLFSLYMHADKQLARPFLLLEKIPNVSIQAFENPKPCQYFRTVQTIKEV